MKIVSLLFILCAMAITSCSKQEDKGDTTIILGKWIVVSSTIYDISNGAPIQAFRLSHPLMGDSVFFDQVGTVRSFALTYNFGVGTSLYSFNAHQNMLTTNIGKSFSFHTFFSGPSMLLLNRPYLDTVSYVPFQVNHMNAIDTLIR